MEKGFQQFLLQNVGFFKDENGNRFLKWKPNFAAIIANLPKLAANPFYFPAEQCEIPTLFIVGERCSYIAPFSEYFRAVCDRFTVQPSNFNSFNARIAASSSSPITFLMRSNFVSAKGDGQIIQRHFPDSRVEVVAGADHNVHATKREELLKLVRDFVG